MNEKFKLLRNPDRIVLSDVFHSIKVEKISLWGVGVKCSYLGGGSTGKSHIMSKMLGVRNDSGSPLNSGQVLADVCRVCTEGRRGSKKINKVNKRFLSNLYRYFLVTM